MAVLILDPAENAAILIPPVNGDGVPNPDWLGEACIQACDHPVRMLAGDIGDRLHGQAAVLNGVVIAFAIPRIIGIIMDAVGVPANRTVAEVLGLSEGHNLLPCAIRRRFFRLGCRGFGTWLHGFPVDRIEFINGDDFACRLKRQAHGQNTDIAGATAFRDDRGDFSRLSLRAGQPPDSP